MVLGTMGVPKMSHDGTADVIASGMTVGEIADLPIGIFDSGLGGLTVWRVLQQELPQESFVYFGDTAHLPYGERSREEIFGYVAQIVAWLQAQPVKLIVMACNTSSALVLDQIRACCDVPILGLILPAAQAAVATGSRIGVIATPATARSGAYGRAIRDCSSAGSVLCWQQSCPEFVPLIETDPMPVERLQQVARQYLDPLLEQTIDTLVYGCTHYPLLADIIRPMLPSTVQIVDPAVALTQAVVQELQLWGLQAPATGQGEPADSMALTRFFVSGDPSAFAHRAARWLPYLPHVQRVNLPAALRVDPARADSLAG